MAAETEQLSLPAGLLGQDCSTAAGAHPLALLIVALLPACIPVHAQHMPAPHTAARLLQAAMPDTSLTHLCQIEQGVAYSKAWQCKRPEGGAAPGDLLVGLHAAIVLDDEDEVKAGQDGGLQVDVVLRRLQVVIPANHSGLMPQPKLDVLHLQMAAGTHVCAGGMQQPRQRSCGGLTCQRAGWQRPARRCAT